MNLFLRTRRLVAANLHDLVDRLQSPELLARQGLRDLAAAIERATSALARSLVAERLLERRRDQQQRRLEHWHARAQEAAGGADALAARQVLGRVFDLQQRVAQFDGQLVEMKQIHVELRRQLAGLREHYQQASEQLSLHAARRVVAGAAQEFAAAGTHGAEALATFGGLQHLLDQVERRAMESEAELELARDLTAEEGERAEDRAWQQFIEAELEVLRKQAAARAAGE